MVFLCCIPICKNAKSGADQKVGFHPFPLITAQREKWIEFIGADLAKFRWRGKYICSDHFLHSEIIEENDKKKLLDGAVPMIFSQAEFDEDAFLERDDLMVSKEPVKQTISNENSTATGCRELRKQFCRLCLSKRSDLLPFTSKLHNVTLTDIIYTITGIKLEANFLMPTKICTSCVSKLDLAFNVRIEVIHNDKRVKNLLKNQQLEYHYKFYDSHRFEAKSVNYDYLNDLLTTVKQEKEEPGSCSNIAKTVPLTGSLVVTFKEPVKQECPPSPQAIGNELFEESIEEEHLLDEEALVDNTYGMPSVPPVQDQIQNKTEPFVEHQNSANQLKQVIDSDSEDDSNFGKNKFVFSWKELYTPKEEPKPRRTFEPKPKPNLIPFTCYTCNISCKDNNELEIHLEEHVNLLPFTCTECTTNEQHKVELKSLYALNKHLESHLYPYKCEHCPNRFLNGNSYLKHLSNHHELHNDGFTCDYCGQHFTKKPPFQRHIAKHRAMEEGRFTCEFCGRAFNCNALLRRHLRIHTGEKPYECRKCGKRFNHAANFQNHKRTHTGERAYQCTECDKTFICSTTLRYHMASHEPDNPKYRIQASIQRPRYSVSAAENNGVKEYKCDVPGCDFSTRLYRAHFYHRSMHRKRFQCEICEKRFPLKANLKKHVAVAHEGKQEPRDKPCPYCPKMFSCRQKLSIHIDVHENNRRHKCRFCEKSFVQKVNCAAHEKIHTGERPHKCRFCEAAFISSSGRTKHEKTHQEWQQLKQKNETIQQEDTVAEVVDFDACKETGYYVEVQQDGEAEDLVEYAPV
ncbi:zinc finger protein 14-like [Sabethes cyaneus]|uniref:zinc finger protein 14-like n=1 Tax=Sabethes cyaneus TaxID=53552 RepID=UPI00237DEC00|nr:zinc finger protein 14-like [Sabethes cyaneus]